MTPQGLPKGTEACPYLGSLLSISCNLQVTKIFTKKILTKRALREIK